MSDARNAPVQEGGPAAPLLAVAGIEKSFPGVRALSGSRSRSHRAKCTRC